MSGYLFFLLVAGCNVQTTTSEIEKDSIVVIEKESHPQQDVDPDSKSANPTMDTNPEDKKDETEQRSDFLIVAGKSIGKINLGMNQEKVLQILGKPDATDAGAGTYVLHGGGKQNLIKVK